MIKIVDTNPAIVEACKALGMEAIHDDIMNHSGVLVSPANSYGMLDGGIDYVYSSNYPHLQGEVFQYIRENGEIPVGQAVAFPLNSKKHPLIILAPTMRTPRKLRLNDLHPYLATKAAYEVYRQYAPWKTPVDLLIPGMGTGVGEIPPKVAAHQMNMALQDFALHHPCWNCIYERETSLGVIDWSSTF